MVRRRGLYRIKIQNKELTCLFCQGNVFSHREIYMSLNSFKETSTEELTLQSFSCETCSDIRMFEEKSYFDEQLQQHVSTITYEEVTSK